MKKTFILMYSLITLMLLVCPVGSDAQSGALQLTAEELATLTAALEDDSKKSPVDEKFRVHVDERDLSTTPGLDEAWLNILLLGTDTGSMQLNYGRTDAMLVLSLHMDTGEMKLTSLVRDMLVDIPNTQMQNRINTANAFGGPLLAVKTVNQVLGTNIRHYCSINFQGFEQIVDHLGGVTLTLSAGEATDTGAKHSSEPQLLNGEQALRYVRIRRLDNNFGRNERQRKFLASLLEQVKSSGYEQVMDAVTIGFQSIATNLSAGEVLSFLPAVVNNSKELAMLSLPQAEAYQHQTTDKGASVVVFDQEQAKHAFHEFVYGKPE